MMKHFTLWLTAIVFLFVSCSKTGNEIDEPQFEIEQSMSSIRELDNVTFSISTSGVNGDVYIKGWYINGALESTNNYFDKMFKNPGTYTIRMEVYHSGNKTSSVEKTVVVSALPSYNVYIKTFEVLKYNELYKFSGSTGSFSMKNYFAIEELDPTGMPEILLQAPETTENVGVNFFKSFGWQFNEKGYKLKVYQTGNVYPKSQTYHTNFVIYGANAWFSTPYAVINEYKIDLNKYRTLKPTTITEVVGPMELKLTLSWE